MTRELRPTVLLVEDDVLQRALASMLLEDSDIHVIECETAEAAVGILNKCGDEISLLFTDVNLAGAMDGVELTNIARQKFPDLNIVVTTGNGGVPRLPDGAMFMPKPWDADDLLREAEKACA